MNQADLNIALHRAAECGDTQAVERLLTEGADISYNIAHVWSPLAAAVERGHLGMVTFLLGHGADPSLGIHWATFSKSLNPFLRLLLDHGADPNAEDFEGLTPLFPACGRNGGYVAAKTLLEAGANPNHRSNDGDTPLMWAAYQRDWWDPENPLVALLAAGADPNLNNEIGAGSVPTTALIWAAREGHRINARILLEHGANPDLTDCTGTTALLAAAARGHTQIVRDLLAAGASAKITDQDGASAKTLAKHHCSELMALLDLPTS